MIDISPTGLWREIQHAEDVLKRRLYSINRINEAHKTPFFQSDLGSEGESEDYRPENAVHTYVSQLKPQLVFYDPKVKITSKVSAPEHPGNDIAKGIQQATNRWIRDTRFARWCEAPCHDGLIGFGAALVSQTENPTVYGTMQNPLWPEVTRISPSNFLRDPEALTQQEVQFIGHRWVASKEDILALADDEPDDWDKVAIEAVAEGTPSRNEQKQQDRPDRKEIEVWDIWVKDYDLDEDNEFDVPKSPGRKKGYWGTIFTLAHPRSEDSSGGSAEFLRKPRPYYGHKSGPYAWWDVDVVADDTYGLSPILAVEGQVREWNRLVRGNTKAAESYKRMATISGAAHDIQDQIESGANGLVIPVAAGFDAKKNIQQFEVGGLTDQMLVSEERAKNRVDRNLGTSDAQRGLATKGATATAEAIADAESDVRSEWVKKKFYDFVADVLTKVAWYIGTSKDIEITLSAGEANELGVMLPPGATASYKGGDLLPIGPGSWDELELQVEPMSMGHSIHGAVQRRAMQAHELKMNALPMITQFPVLDFWRKEFERLGDVLNISGFADEIEPLVELGQLMLGLQIEAQQAEIQPEVDATGTASVAGKSGDRNNKPMNGMKVARGSGGALPGTQSGNELLPITRGQ